MKEEYLHYVFERRMLGMRFVSTEGKELVVRNFGELNSNAGPDFLDAKIEYNGQLWVGAIEFHIKASDWYRHNHQNDPAYGTVIAHFVYDPDQEVIVGDYRLPMVNICSLIDSAHYQHYLSMVEAKAEIVCHPYLGNHSFNALEEQKSVSLKKRLQLKALLIIRDIEDAKGNYFFAYLLLLARCFGGTVNQIPFEAIALKIKLNWLSKLNYDRFKIEALFLGLGGFLQENKENDVYINQLQHEFNYQKQLFQLTDHVIGGWKYSRMRPLNFPDRRLAQFAHYSAILAQKGDFFSQNRIDGELFKSISLPTYWEYHYRVGHKSQRRLERKVSKNLIDLIRINVEIPFEFAIGWLEMVEYKQSRAIEKLRTISPEKNRITTEWRKMKIPIASAYDSQALLALKKQSCIRKKCLFCALGKSILNK